MMYEDKYNLLKNESRFLLKKNIVNIIYSLSKLEDVKATLPQTKTIIEGMSVSGVSMDDVQVIVNLKNAYQFILNSDINRYHIIDYACKINEYVSYNESLEWGVLRKGNVTISGVSYVPNIPDKEDIKENLLKIMKEDISDTHKILKYMYYAMREQFFWDGNKRTAIATANALMMHHGLGLININESQLEVWNEMLSEYYETNDNSKIIKWTYDNCIYGIDR